MLLCDEPTGALDIATGIVVLEALARVNAELGTTTVVITHNAAIAAMADRVIRLADGRVTDVEERTDESSRRASCRGERHDALRAQPQAAARPPGDEGAGARPSRWSSPPGVAMFVMYLSNFDRCGRRSARYYERQRFADVFASLKRAPLRLAADIAAIPGVVGGRDARRRHGDARPAGPRRAGDRPAGLDSAPDRRPALNDLFLRRGRWIEPDRPDEVLASEGFVDGARPRCPATRCRRSSTAGCGA